MLAVLRFSFSKELKFVRARLGKPYNSALGMSSAAVAAAYPPAAAPPAPPSPFPFPFSPTSWNSSFPSLFRLTRIRHTPPITAARCCLLPIQSSRSNQTKNHS